MVSCLVQEVHAPILPSLGRFIIYSISHSWSDRYW